MRSRSATEVPPYFCTTSVTGSSHSRSGTTTPLRARAPTVFNEWPSSNQVAPARQGTTRENSTMASAALEHDTTVDPGELAKFAALSRDWWDTTRPMAPLHKPKPGRVAHTRDQARARVGGGPRRGRPRDGLRALDIGCGGGLLAEPLARLGAAVTGVDPVASSIETARWHAAEVGLEIAYEPVTIETVGGPGRRFDPGAPPGASGTGRAGPEFLRAMPGGPGPAGLAALRTLAPPRRASLRA